MFFLQAGKEEVQLKAIHSAHQISAKIPTFLWFEGSFQKHK